VNDKEEVYQTIRKEMIEQGYDHDSIEQIISRIREGSKKERWTFDKKDLKRYVKYCPACGSDNIEIPEWGMMKFEWICKACGCWFEVS
jgi:hypothetical protein